LTLLLLVVSIISGYGWDIRTSDLVSNLTGGLLNRKLAADLHSAIVFLLVAVLLLHIAPSVLRFFMKKRQR
jgi:cytochrome b